MKKLLVLAGVALLVLSCSNDEKRIISIEKKVVAKQPVIVHPNTVLNVEIAGMSCEHACGGAIRTALKETNAVDRCSFIDFSTENEYNVAKITYDQAKISEKEILDLIEDLNDHQFTTGKATTAAIDAKKS